MATLVITHSINISSSSRKPPTVMEETVYSASKSELDALFHTHLSKKYPSDARDSLKAALVSHLQTTASKIELVDRMFDGDSLQAREQGAKEGLALRRAMVTDIFQRVVRPEIQKIMHDHGDSRSFDDVIAIDGFNRLWVREKASAGTDHDFIMLIDSDDSALVDHIRRFMKNEVRPCLQHAGMDMEATDYLMIPLGKYLDKLGDTRKALFTLANMTPENTFLITGSQTIHDRAFTLSDDLLAEHYGNLLLSHGLISDPTDATKFKQDLVHKLRHNGPAFRQKIVSHLQKMASSELYIGRKPYDKKQTIQTIMSKLSPTERHHCTAPFSIKFCINRIADLIISTGLEPIFSGIPFTRSQVNKLENLGLVLSNIICRQNTSGHPLLTVQEGYSEITLEHLQNMSKTDREIVAELLTALDIPLNPSEVNFAKRCYKALWSLGDQMYSMAQKLEKTIYADAFQFAGN